VRIDGWHVDGFGVLKDFDQGDLPPGVTVLLGENEAGKSTLLAFVRAILFGFPDGRSKGRSYPPLLGGRHGGKLVLRDRSEALWVVQRFGDDRKALGLLRPDGSEGDAADLGNLLGGADAQLFKSVFAFGLDELQALESLTGEGVRDRIFSAGISGAGKSAREVMRGLEQSQDALLKQKAGKAKMNDIVREILQVDEEERAARTLAGQYQQLLQDEAEQSDLERELQSDSDRQRRRKTEVEAFVELRPQWDDMEEMRLELKDLPEVTDEALPAAVAAVVKELEGQCAREERLEELQATRAAETAALQEALRRLGDGWNTERARSFNTSVEVEDDVGGWEQRLTDAESSLHDAARNRGGADVDAARLLALAVRARPESPDAEPLSVEEIDRRESLVRTLREDGARLETLRLRAEQESPRPAASRSWLASVFAGLAALGAAASWLAGYAQIGVGLLAAALLVTLVGVLTRSRGPASAAGESTQSSVIDGLVDSIGKTAESIGLPRAATTQDLGELDGRLRTERTRRADWDNASFRILEAEQQADEGRRLAQEAASAEKQAQEARDKEVAGWLEWLVERTLARLSPAGVLVLLKQVDAACAADDRRSTAIGAMDAINQKADEWARSAERVLGAAGRPATGLTQEMLRTATEELHADLVRRATLVDRVATLERTIGVRLARCDDPEAAASDLAIGDAGVWDDELGRLATELTRLRAERDSAIKAADKARGEREGIEESADIPRLQEQRESLCAELANLADDYRVVATANALIAETLKTYVRDRQPAVLASGSEAFAAVTRGRYTRVQQDEEGGLESVVVVKRDGQQLRPDLLSKGTQQQLYLSIRLALVAEFAKRTAPLPLIMDDCLVNFDPKRAAAVAGLLAERSADGQCLLFTCHPETAELMARQTAGPVKVIEMALA